MPANLREGRAAIFDLEMLTPCTSLLVINYGVSHLDIASSGPDVVFLKLFQKHLLLNDNLVMVARTWGVK